MLKEEEEDQMKSLPRGQWKKGFVELDNERVENVIKVLVVRQIWVR